MFDDSHGSGKDSPDSDTMRLAFFLLPTHPMLPISNNFTLSTGFTAIDPTLQHLGPNWMFPMDGNQHQQSISGPTGSNPIPPHVSVPGYTNMQHSSIYHQDPSSKHLNHDDILNIICQASERDLTTSSNAAYMRLELTLVHVTNEKTQLEGLKCLLEEEVIRLQSRLQTIM